VLVSLSLLLSYALGVLIGLVQVRLPRWADGAITVGTTALFAMPGYWLGVLLMWLLVYHWRLLPAFGVAGLDAEFLPPGAQLTDRLRHLRFPDHADAARRGRDRAFARGALVDVRAAAFVTAARGRGLSAAAVDRRYLLRNALVPVITLLGLSLPALFSGAVFVEAVFAWPGVGRVMVEAVQARDYPVVMAAATVSAILVWPATSLPTSGWPGPTHGCDMGDRRPFRDPRAAGGAAILVIVCATALLAPLVATHDPAATGDVVATRFLPPFSTDAAGQVHLLGTDRLGRDVWSRLAFGARVSLATGLLATLIATLLSTGVGLVSGVWRGRVGAVLLGVTDFALALPRVVLLLLLAALWQPGGMLVIVVLGLTGWMSTARLVHGEAVAAMTRPYVAAARALGARRGRIAVRHVLPNVVTPVIIASALGVGNAIMLEAGLSFLGLGVQPLPHPGAG
jgi:peptide/nickel transport system permease protein